MASASNRQEDFDYVNGPGSGLPSHVPAMGGDGFGGHSMKGIIGRERAKTYVPSSYENKDKGGSAGGYGLPHGMGGGGDGGAMGGGPMVSIGYAGDTLGFEGGVRAGGVSEHETMPAQYPFPKRGDKSSETRGTGSVHGVDGVEGIEHGEFDASEAGADERNAGSDGFACPHGCAMGFKTGHGVARHVHAKHGGFGGLGHAFKGGKDNWQNGKGTAPKPPVPQPTGVPSVLGVGHGSGLNPDKEYRGETEGPAEMSQIRNEYAAAEREIPGVGSGSSYSRGDAGH